MSANVATILAGSRSGRILLHALCLLRHPGNARWHWKGIRRELQF